LTAVFRLSPNTPRPAPGTQKSCPRPSEKDFRLRKIVADVSKSFPGAPEIDSGTPESFPRASEMSSRSSDMSSGASDLSSGASEIGPKTSEIGPGAPEFGSWTSEVSPRTLEFSSGAPEFCPSSEGPISRRGWFKDGGLATIQDRQQPSGEADSADGGWEEELVVHWASRCGMEDRGDLQPADHGAAARAGSGEVAGGRAEADPDGDGGEPSRVRCPGTGSLPWPEIVRPKVQVPNCAFCHVHQGR